MQIDEKKVRYVDRPEVSETFVDNVRMISVDGRNMKMEFCVTRAEEPKGNQLPGGTRYPACRLVMSVETAIELVNQLQGLFTAMEQQGMIKRNPPQSPPGDQTVQ